MRLSGKQTKRAVSLLLCLALLVSMLAFALTVRAEEVGEPVGTEAENLAYDSSNSNDDLTKSQELAGTGAAGDYVYCNNTAGWSTVTAYMWNKAANGNSNTGWPGAAMTKVSGNIWRYQVPRDDLDMIIFSQNGNSQTGDLTYPGAGYIYDNSTKQWSKYDQAPTTQTPTSGGDNPTSAPQPTQSGSTSGKTYVYCENEAGWSTVTAYMWIGGSQSGGNASWPGKAMTNIGGNIWRYEVTNSSWNMIIFSQNGSNQTTDLSFPGKDYIWNNKTNSWSIYDTSPLQVGSFTTDVESPQFNGVGITLSASAEGQGTVYYKFSVTNSSGATTVLSDYSTANAAQWIPQVVGTYTLNYEFKDATGNTNKRTKTYVIEDGLSSVAPYIKTVTPNGGEIQNNKTCNLSVAAGGGFTGTNLLFYKYTVKDAAGNTVNTPYYTRNTAYSFKPTSLGAYSVTVSVQGSDNKTIERTYHFTSVGSVTPTTAPATQPPTTAPKPTQTPAPTQAPTQPPTSAAFINYGDADDDGDITILDVTYIQRYDALVQLPSPLNERNADVDADGIVTIVDATYIERYEAGVIDRFPAEA